MRLRGWVSAVLLLLCVASSAFAQQLPNVGPQAPFGICAQEPGPDCPQLSGPGGPPSSSWFNNLTLQAGAAADQACNFVLNQCYSATGGWTTAAAALTVSRASVENCADSQGVYIQVGNNLPCVTDLGLWVWEARTNSLRTADMTGAVAIDTLLVNGYFATGPPTSGTGWTVGLSGGAGSVVFAQGTAAVTGDGTNTAYIEQSIATTNGVVYEVNTTSDSTVALSVGTTQGASNLASATPNGVSQLTRFTATGSTTWVRLGKTSAGVVNLSALSVQPERITNGNFTGTSGTGWTVILNSGTGSVSFAVTGQASLTGDGVNQTNLTQSITTVIGLTYTVTVDVAAQNVFVQVGNSAGSSALLGTTVTVGTGKKAQFTATATTTFVGFAVTAAVTPIVSNISVQSAGKLPNNWGWFDGSINMLRTVVALPTVKGLPGISVRLHGTVTGAGSAVLIFDNSAANIAALVGQVWSQSAIASLSGGSLTNIGNSRLVLEQYNSVPTFQGALTTVSWFASISAAPTRFSGTVAFDQAATAFLRPVLYHTAVGAGAVDATIDLAAPQLELNPSTQALTAPTTAGGVNGTIGAGGVLPTTSGTSWIETTGIGLTNVVAFAVHSGQNVMDSTLSGTISSGAAYNLQSASSALSPATSPGEQVVGTTYYQTVVDDADITSVVLQLDWLDSGNSVISSLTTSIPKPAALTQYSVTGTAPALTARALLRVRHFYSGTPTIAYQYYVGPWSLNPNRGMATSPILTTAAAATRAGMIARLAVAPTFDGTNLTLFAKGTPAAPLNYATQNQNMLQADTGSDANRSLIRRQKGDGSVLNAQVGGSGVSIAGAVVPQNTQFRDAFALGGANSAASQNGAAVVTSNQSPGGTYNRVGMGIGDGPEYFNGPIAAEAIWARQRLPNAVLPGINIQ